jgi:nucleotide-binding universal stress UspA family protein
MKTALLILSSTSPTPMALSRALERCKAEGAKLVAALVTDPEVAEGLSRRAMSSGFLGEGVSKMINTALEEDDNLRIDACLRSVRETAEQAGIACETTEAEGRFAPTVLRLVGECQADLIIIAREQRSLLARLLFGSPINELRKVPDLDLEVINET